jgi:predicted GNAT family acetyltransferase
MVDEPVTVRVTDDKARRRYEAYVDNVLAAYATYELTPGGIVFLHTETEPAFEGHGVGSHLAQAALDDARARGLRVTPRCPFIAGYIKRHPAYAELVAHSP